MSITTAYKLNNSPIVLYPNHPNKKPCNKQKGKKSEVYDFALDDAKKILEYFKQNNKWLHYLMFIISCNIARRNGDVLSLKWFNFFDPKTGDFRNDLYEIEEEKTGKISNPHINSAVKNAINLYLSKVHFDPATDNYSWDVFYQFTGTHAGKTLSYDGCRKAIKNAAAKVGITYNVGTHSNRKSFGAMSRMLHPNDNDSMEILGTIYNHSSEKITRRYIGITKKKVDAYYDDIGQLFDEYILGDKEMSDTVSNPMVVVDINDLRDIITQTYKAGSENAGKSDPIVHIEAINQIMQMIENVRK